MGTGARQLLWGKLLIQNLGYSLSMQLNSVFWGPEMTFSTGMELTSAAMYARVCVNNNCSGQTCLVYASRP